MGARVSHNKNEIDDSLPHTGGEKTDDEIQRQLGEKMITPKKAAELLKMNHRNARDWLSANAYNKNEIKLQLSAKLISPERAEELRKADLELTWKPVYEMQKKRLLHLEIQKALQKKIITPRQAATLRKMDLNEAKLMLRKHEQDFANRYLTKELEK